MCSWQHKLGDLINGVRWHSYPELGEVLVLTKDKVRVLVNALGHS